MSGPNPKQQKSRSPKKGWKTTQADLDVMTKEEVVETVKEISIEEGSFFDRFKSNEGEEDEHSEG